jgi:hypothetical protein
MLSLIRIRGMERALEEQKDCSFVKKSGSKKGKTVEYFTCNRGGDYVPKGNGKRRLKSQGEYSYNIS